MAGIAVGRFKFASRGCEKWNRDDECIEGETWSSLEEREGYGTYIISFSLNCFPWWSLIYEFETL